MPARGLLVAFLLLVSGCAFSSESPLFSDGEAQLIFGEHQVLSWRDRTDGEAFNVSFDKVGQGYDLNRIDEPDERPLHATFVPIADTPEDDYVAQILIASSADSGATAYGFVWREGEGYRVFADPAGFSSERQPPQGAEQFCRPLAQGECEFATRADLLGYYRQIIYPRFVQGHAAPANYVDLGPPLPDAQGH